MQSIVIGSTTMKIGIFAKTFPGTAPSDVLNACRQTDFEAVQYNMACSGLSSLPKEIPPGVVDSIRHAARQAEIEIAAISATYNMADPRISMRVDGRAAFAAIAKNANAMGTGILTVCSGSCDPDNQWRWHRDNSSSQAWSDMCHEFEIISEIAIRENVIVGVEPEHANIVSNARQARKLLDEFAGGPIRIVLDPANLLESIPGGDRERVLDEAFDLLGEKIVLAHAKDRDESGKAVAAGTGVVDWLRFTRGLHQLGYEGSLIAHGMSSLEAPQVSTFLHKTLASI